MNAGRTARLERAFGVAAAELGHCSAAWLFVREVAGAAGESGGAGTAAVEELRDGLGRSFPVLDAVARCWLEGRTAQVDPSGVLAACAGATRVLVTGVEARHLDALAAAAPPELQLGLLRHGPPGVDWGRVLANHGERVEGVDLAEFQRWAGGRSVLLAFCYGVHGGRTCVNPAWVRVHGPDVRTQFRTLVGWDVLGAPMYVYPRWMVEVPAEDFSVLLGGPG